MRRLTANENTLSFDNCIILKNLTPRRKPSDHIYLCSCRLCGRRFIRSKRWLTYGYNDCGCISDKNTNNVKANDYLIKSLDKTSKDIFKMKLDALGNANVSAAFEILYIKQLKLNEYTAISNYMSLSTLFRCRNKILSLWPKLKNEIMEEQLNVLDKSNSNSKNSEA